MIQSKQSDMVCFFGDPFLGWFERDRKDSLLFFWGGGRPLKKAPPYSVFLARNEGNDWTAIGLPVWGTVKCHKLREPETTIVHEAKSETQLPKHSMVCVYLPFTHLQPPSGSNVGSYTWSVSLFVCLFLCFFVCLFWLVCVFVLLSLSVCLFV